MDEATAKRIVIGRIGSVYGVRGWLKILSFTEPRKNILTYQPWQLYNNGSWQEVAVEQGRVHGAGIIAKLTGCDDRDVARRYTNADIAIFRHQLPPLKTNEYYWADLEGLTVVTTSGVILGTIDHLFNTGANDVLVVKGDKTHLIPYLKDQVVMDINIDKSNITVDWDPEF